MCYNRHLLAHHLQGRFTIKALLAVILVILIGCSGAAQAEWTEQEAIAVVQYKLSERLEACEIRNCIASQDPVLIALGIKGRPRPSFGVNLGFYTAKVLLEQGDWTAVYEPDSLRWRVQVIGSELKPLIFYAYERTSLVQGVAPP
jgi:hypothetical protein